jgi:hypothetical protein
VTQPRSLVRRQLGAISLGGLPGNTGDDNPPPGFSGYLVKVTGVDEQAWAESGFGARTSPGFTRHGGTLSYYDSSTSSYQSVALKDLTADLEVALGTVSGSWTHDSQTFTVAVTGTLRAGSTTLVPPITTAPDPDCKDSACEQAATVASTLVANLTYEVTVGTAVTTRFTLVADLGAPLARSSYKAAFDA